MQPLRLRLSVNKGAQICAFTCGNSFTWFGFWCGKYKVTFSYTPKFARVILYFKYTRTLSF